MVRVELTTGGLQNRCSATELHRLVVTITYYSVDYIANGGLCQAFLQFISRLCQSRRHLIKWWTSSKYIEEVIPIIV